MNSKILKLDAPYNVIYAGGLVGRHIATLMTWSDEMFDSTSYPILDLGEEFPAGKLVMEDLDDCRVICPPGGTNIYWVAKMIEYDFQQEEPAGAEYILERMKLLGCRIVFPKTKNADGEEVQEMNFDATLDFMCVEGFGGDEGDVYRVLGNRWQGFYFQAVGTKKEIYQELHYQLSIYQTYFRNDLISIRFQTDDWTMDDIINKLNASQGIEGYKDEDNA